MELLTTILNVENWHLVIAFVLMMIGLFGQPYYVRATTKKKFDSKLDKTELIKLEDKIQKKADTIYVEDKIKVLHHRIDDTNSKQKEFFDLLLTEVQESKKDIKKILGQMKIK